ncbi:hypothetical protein VTN77DRAFT_963 [Rasamsonia byssochlamydoides]|uniref:uncharacterized protein n=1 Tax=Rasamsonia byssochlamydoides TaxID=89139 RepID=UPI0037434C4D
MEKKTDSDGRKGGGRWCVPPWRTVWIVASMDRHSQMGQGALNRIRRSGPTLIAAIQHEHLNAAYSYMRILFLLRRTFHSDSVQRCAPQRALLRSHKLGLISARRFQPFGQIVARYRAVWLAPTCQPPFAVNWTLPLGGAAHLTGEPGASSMGPEGSARIFHRYHLK